MLNLHTLLSTVGYQIKMQRRRSRGGAASKTI